ncbi:hypothetical protein JTB14_021278 [Gonioctena quinquepunctata]|nr:hypothetical protein JTB14_021278 [Gonioctena quinquepunctata]
MKAIPRPRWRPQAIVFEIVTNKKIDMFIMLFIGLNMLTMTMDHYQQKETFTKILDYLNMIFIVIFSTECLMKMFALRYHYFTEPWNLFDLVVVILSILGLVLSDIIIEKYFVLPTLLRLVRVAKVGRVLCLVKGAKGIRTLLFALAMSLPALFNICLLLFLVMFIFAIFGISFFMHVKNKSGLDDVYNFKTFGQSMILLFQMSTSAGWDGVLNGIINEEECKQPDNEIGETGNCGNSTIGIAFLLSYLVISFLIVMNMYIAVILENYSQATEDVQEGLTDDDYDMYYEIWQQFDPDGTQYIRYDQLSDFLDVLEPPLQIHKPNMYKIISMDIPICKGDLMFCVDILDALTKDFFAPKGNAIEETAELAEVQGRPHEAGYEPVSSTLWRQREEYCARLIQNAWRKHKRNRGGATDPSDEGEVDVEGELEARQTAVLVERNGHKVLIHSLWLEKDILPSLKIYMAVLKEKTNNFENSFNNYAERLKIVRQEKIKTFGRTVGGIYAGEEDLYSEAGSSVGSSGSSSRSRSSSASAKNRRKAERKKTDLREGGHFEDIALMRALHILYTETASFGKEIREVCLIVENENKDECKELHEKFSHLQKDMIKQIPEIWLEVFAKDIDSTDREILAIIQNKQDLDPKYCTPPPEYAASLSWRLDIFS